jgi:hypothetical protein
MPDPIDVPQRTGNYGPQKDPHDFGAIRQVGIDQAIKTQTIAPATVLPSVTTVPRDATLNPLRVVLPKVKAGNYLEVDLTIAFAMEGPEGTGGTFVAMVVVSFDGSTAIPGTFALIDNAAGVAISSIPLNTTLRGNAMVLIPDGATDATVEVTYFLDNTVTIVGNDVAAFEPEGSTTLKATEYNAVFVTQPGPGSLVPLV